MSEPLTAPRTSEKACRALTDAGVRPAVARASGAAVKHVLDREVDVDALRLAGNLNPVSEGRDSPMSPAGAAVLKLGTNGARKRVVRGVVSSTAPRHIVPATEQRTPPPPPPSQPATQPSAAFLEQLPGILIPLHHASPGNDMYGLLMFPPPFRMVALTLRDVLVEVLGDVAYTILR